MNRKMEGIGIHPKCALRIAVALLMVSGWLLKAEAAILRADVGGEIERFTLDNTADPWSGAKMQVAGGLVIIPRNLLMDLPANRLSPKQFFDQAPAECVALGESGVAKGDVCNKSGTGGVAVISANRNDAGNVIAGDVLIQKGIGAAVSGVVTYIDHSDGYFRVGGAAGDPSTGTMVRLNDPRARHTIQRGLGCAGGPNCSADPRFALDADNYTNVFHSGYPYCIPSTVARTFAQILPGETATTSQAAADGSGDYLCPLANNPADYLVDPADDSRRFGALKVGDTISAEGNLETVTGADGRAATFLSAHTSEISKAIRTKNLPTQPDYVFLKQEVIETPPWFAQRAGSVNVGFTTLAPSDVLFWTIHYDPVTNAPHEFPYDSVQGCDAAAGVGSCSAQGLAGAGDHIFQIANDVNFRLAAVNDPPGGARADLSPCLHIIAEPRFNAAGLCGTIPTLAEEMAVFMPFPHEIQARTGHKLAHPALRAIDVSGNEATWGQYLFPLGINLGGVLLQDFAGIDLDLIDTPTVFEGLPWNLDRRLSPGGCLDTGCEATPQPLDPFPVSGLDPRTAFRDLVLARNPSLVGDVPRTPYSNGNFTAIGYDNVIERIFGYVDPNQPRRAGPASLTTSGEFPGDALPDADVLAGNFDGANALAPFPPGAPAPRPIEPVTPVTLVFLPANTPVMGVTLAADPPSPASGGPTVAFTASAKGVSGAYEYRFLGRRAGVAAPLSVARAYDPSATWNWSTAGVPGGTYEIQVQARNAGSAVPFEATQTVNYTVTTPSAAAVSLTASPAGPQLPGTLVTFTANATGGGTYEYQFTGRKVGDLVFSVGQSYSELNAWTWNTAGVTPGSYEVIVLARAAGSTAAFEATTTILYTVAASSIAVDLAASPASGTAAAGASITFTGTATPAGGSYEYQFLGRRTGDPAYGTAQPYGPADSWTWTGVTGSWDIQVQVRNVGSAEPFEAQQTIVYAVN
jgi:hypothetical protein